MSIENAVRNRDLAAVQQHLANGNSPDMVSEQSGESILATAAFQGDIEIVQLLIDAGADPNFLGTTAWPLDLAAGQGYSAIVETLLFADADIDSLDEDSGTALMSAAAGGYIGIVETLLEAGADPRRKDCYGKRSIAFAAEKGHVEIVNLLASLSTPKDRQQASLMIKLAQQGPPSQEIKNFFQAAERGDMHAVKEYLDAGGDVNAIDEEGWTAVFEAAHRGHINIIELLIAHGADINHIDNVGSYPLVYVGKNRQKALYDYIYSLTNEKLQKDWNKREKKAMAIARERGYIQ